MYPTIGRIVLYRVGEYDVKQFTENGNEGNVRKGSILPAMITAVFSETCVNLKVIGDCPKDAWLTSRNFLNDGDIANTENQGWYWPKRD